MHFMVQSMFWVERLLYSVQCAKYVHKHREFSCPACVVKVMQMLIFVIISPHFSPFVHVLGVKGCCTLCNTQEDIHSVLNEYTALLNNANILE